ncbi:MAG TPA: hypothetical protein VF530_06895 [Planctomycetota bacterium]
MGTDPRDQDDTSPAARALQAELYRRMSPGEKLALVLDLTDTSDAFARAGLRLRHPREDERAITLRLAELKYGRELVEPVRSFLASEG